MKIKVLYRKNLKMSTGKIAAQVSHAVIGLGVRDPECSIVVLQASDKKFNEKLDNWKEKILNKQPHPIFYIHKDFGLTEVEEGTITCAAWIHSDDVNVSDMVFIDGEHDADFRKEHGLF